MSECHHRILHQNDHGYISICDACARIQIGFGTALISFTRREFSDFRERIMTEYASPKSNPESRQKNLFIETSARNWHLALSGMELFKLTDLLEKADVMINWTDQRSPYYN